MASAGNLAPVQSLREESNNKSDNTLRKNVALSSGLLIKSEALPIS